MSILLFFSIFFFKIHEFQEALAEMWVVVQLLVGEVFLYLLILLELENAFRQDARYITGQLLGRGWVFNFLYLLILLELENAFHQDARHNTGQLLGRGWVSISINLNGAGESILTRTPVIILDNCQVGQVFQYLSILLELENAFRQDARYNTAQLLGRGLVSIPINLTGAGECISPGRQV